jgi:D-alanyl-D-alanine carboxypeptidase/D-alanyl-D-alanine-endopeptidase (penicillin-binding protein 4)
VAALVVRARDGEVLYAREPDERLVPASNQKILTAIAALATYGPTHRFTTTVLSSAPPDVHGHVGDVWVRGGGDPALTSEDWWRLSADLRRRGLARSTATSSSTTPHSTRSAERGVGAPQRAPTTPRSAR